MSGFAMALSVGVIDASGVPASARVPVNMRVQCEAGPIGVLPEAMVFPGPASVSGTWVLGTTRVSVDGIPAINTVSMGTAYSPAGPPSGPMQIIQPSTRLEIT